ncbi:MAG: acyl-CoA dehydrogenase family protein [Dehalococcoidia bacterium]
MDFRDDEGEVAWRADVRRFLREEAPSQYRDQHLPPVDSYGMGDELFQIWRATVARKRWLAPHWPAEYGGLGLSVMEQFILKEEFATHRVPHPGARATEMVGPTIILHGTEEQKRGLLPPILQGEYVYCQGFSEPGAGSDLASLQLRAVRDGDEYVLNGQKIWTSNATTCNWMFLLARTDPDAPKHRGISYFVTPMETPGLTVRPIEDMVDGSDLCETFFDNVRIPAAYRIGEENRGWYVAMTTLDFERSGIAGAIALQQQILDLRALLPPFATRDPRRTELADLYLSSEAGRLMSLQVASLQARGQAPNYEASMVKLFASELGQRTANATVRFLGPRGTLDGGSRGYEVIDGRCARQYSRVLPSTIAGGTSEIQRNIIATRGLGLPRG